MRATTLSRDREKELIDNIRSSLETEYKAQIESLKTNYEHSLNYTKKALAEVSDKYEHVTYNESELRSEYNRIIKNRNEQDFKKNCYGTFTIGFEDKNITLERFKHYLKISLDIDNTDFLIHSVRAERMIGTVKQTASSTIFGDEEGSNEIIKFYVSFYTSKNKKKELEFLSILKNQVKEGISKLSLINPLFLGINYGKITVNDEDYNKISLDKFDLIFREGIYIKSTYLLCSIYEFKNIKNKEISIKILAFDNQNGIEYIIDLDYFDLLDIFDSNVKALEPSKDLATYLINCLAYFKNKDNEEILV